MMRALIDVYSPSNIPWLNPVIQSKTAKEGGYNLVRGAANWLGACPDSIQRDGAVKGMSGSGPGIGGFGRFWRIGGVQAVARSAADRLRPWASLSMLWARQTRPHSWATLSSPRIRN